GDFTRLVKYMRFPTQTRESPHFRASTRAIVKPFLVGCSRPARTSRDRLAWLKKGPPRTVTANRSSAVTMAPRLRERATRVLEGKRLLADGAVLDRPNRPLSGKPDIEPTVAK